MGQASLGKSATLPVGALILNRTFSFARIDAAPPLVISLSNSSRPGFDAGKMDCPAFASFALPPTIIGVGAGVDDVADLLIGEFLEFGQNLIGCFSSACIHQHDALRPDLHANVATGSGDHIEVRPDPKYLNSSTALLSERDRGASVDAKKNSNDGLHRYILSY